MISAGRLSEFIDEIISIRNEELNEKTAWEYYLHRIYDRSFEDFYNSAEKKESAEVDLNEIEATIKRSQEILKSFKLN